MNKELLLAYTELPENLIEDILDIDPAEQPPERMRRRPQILRDEFLALSDRIHAAPQRSRRFAQQCALPLPADQSSLA